MRWKSFVDGFVFVFTSITIKSCTSYPISARFWSWEPVKFQFVEKSVLAIDGYHS